MNIQDKTIAKIRRMPESLVQEVNDFIDFLWMKHNGDDWELWLHRSDSIEIVEADFSDYLTNLENYEDRLAQGEIQW
jgi:hypothetical protein